MAVLKEQKLIKSVQSQAPPRILSAPGRKKGVGAFLKSLFKALRARNKQVSSQPPQRSAQDLRDELQANNPWWGNGL